MELNAKKEIGIIIFSILQPAIAGGMSEKRAEEIYNEIMQNISDLHPSENQFNTLLEDIINKCAIPIIGKSGIKIDLMDIGKQGN
jgi:hypothetical protein